MRKKWVIPLVCVLLVAAVGVILWGWYYKGYPTTVSTAVVSPLPEGVFMELTEVTKTGGVLVCLVDTEEDSYHTHVQIDGHLWSVEKLSEDGQWFELARGKFPLQRTARGPSYFNVGENLVQVDWKQAYGTLSRGDYRLVICLIPASTGSDILVEVPFSVA